MNRNMTEVIKMFKLENNLDKNAKNQNYTSSFKSSLLSYLTQNYLNTESKNSTYKFLYYATLDVPHIKMELNRISQKGYILKWTHSASRLISSQIFTKILSSLLIHKQDNIYNCKTKILYDIEHKYHMHLRDIQSY